MSIYRNGFNIMWRTVPKIMRACRVLPPGSYDRHNHHNGVMPGWPKESTLTNLRVSKILRACIQSKKLTLSQLETVRKSMSYLWELTGKKTKRESNWPCVGTTFESTVRKENLRPTDKSRAMCLRVPRPQDLRKAILKGWTPDNKYPFIQWLGMFLCFWDSQVCGARAKVDVEKIKKSREHDYNFKAGWQCTAFKGGRAKLTGMKKGSRPWSVYRICLCEGEKHIRPPKTAWSYIDEHGNPTKDLGFDHRCPLAAVEMVWQCQLEDDEPKRDYPNFVKWSRKSEAWYGPLNVGDPTQAGLNWLAAQGVGEFDHNSGRKSLASWCRKLHVPYQLSFQIHGDLYDVWLKHYQDDLNLADPHSKIREQSTDPMVATAALRIFAKYLKRGINAYEPQMTLVERQNQILIAQYMGQEAANNVLLGLPVNGIKKEETFSSDDSDNVPFRPPVPKRKRRRSSQGARPARKCKRVVKFEEEEEDYKMQDPPPPRKRRRRTLQLPAQLRGEKPKKKKKLSRPKLRPVRKQPIRIRLRKLGEGRYKVIRRRRRVLVKPGFD